MHNKVARLGICVGVALLGIVFVSCDSGYRQITVVDGEKAELITWGAVPQAPQETWVSGRTVIFRTDSDFPGSPKRASGKAGKVYRISDSHELEEIGQFALTMPNDTLAYQLGR